ncbi:MAG TPA: uroporphyrinogen-III synthase [Candidatus Acidoferrum sp.]|nr:uroporphyrinogen-III synthase [Candidatus Acidoferrum sp.]
MADVGKSALTGKTIVVTRAAEQSGKLTESLIARGAQVKLLPMISFAAPESYGDLDTVLKRLDEFDWIIFTSANAVQAVERRCRELGTVRIETLKHVRAAAVGPTTAAEAEHAGFLVDYVAKNHSGAGLADELKEEVKGKSVLVPRSDRASPDLPKALQRMRAAVTEVIAYRTLPPNLAEQGQARDSLNESVDGILFFSPSAVQNFLELLGPERLKTLQGRTVMVAIGPATASALSRAGIQRIGRAADTTAEAVIAALEGHLARTRARSATEVKS